MLSLQDRSYANCDVCRFLSKASAVLEGRNRPHDDLSSPGPRIYSLEKEEDD